MAAATAETVKSKFNDMRNSSLFKSFESKLGTAYTSVSVRKRTTITKSAVIVEIVTGDECAGAPHGFLFCFDFELVD